LAACLIATASAETVTLGEDDGENAWEASVAWTEDGEMAISIAAVEDYTGAAPVIDTAASDVDGASAGQITTVTDAAVVSASSSASELGGSSASTSVVATDVTDLTTVQGATTQTGAGSAAGQITVADAGTIGAVTEAEAADGAEAGAAVMAANFDGTIVQGAAATGAAVAGQIVQTSGDDQALFAETWAEDGDGCEAETTTVLDSEGFGFLTLAQGAIADPGVGAAAGQFVLYEGSGMGRIGSYTDADSDDAEAEVDLETRYIGDTVAIYGQGAATDGSGAIGGQAGLIAGTGIIRVNAETEAETEDAEAEAEAGVRGNMIVFGQIAAAEGSDSLAAQRTLLWGAGFAETEVENAAGEAGTFAGTRDRDGFVNALQIAEADNAGVGAEQQARISAPSGVGEAETWAENGRFPYNYASVEAGVVDGGLFTQQQATTNLINPRDAAARQVVIVADAAFNDNSEAGAAWTHTEAGDGFRSFASVGTRVVDGALVAESGAYAGRWIGAGERSINSGTSSVTTARASSFWDRDFDHVHNQINVPTEAYAGSTVFGPAFAIVI